MTKRTQKRKLSQKPKSSVGLSLVDLGLLYICVRSVLLFFDVLWATLASFLIRQKDTKPNCFSHMNESLSRTYDQTFNASRRLRRPLV